MSVEGKTKDTNFTRSTNTEPRLMLQSINVCDAEEKKTLDVKQGLWKI
jgi:hypothetical protein